MLITHFFTINALMLIFGSMVMVGWFLVTRGDTSIEIDGTVKKEGALLKGWYFFWFAENEDLADWNMKQYKYQQLYGILESIKFSCQIQNGFEIDELTHSGFRAPESFREHIKRIEAKLDVKIEYNHNTSLWEVSKKETVYVFPWWIRTPMAGCITCFASVYGTIIFTIFHLLAWTILVDDIKYSMLDWMYGWSALPILAMAVNYLSSLLIWTYLNTLLYKLLGK